MDTKNNNIKVTSVYITERNLKFLNRHRVKKYSRMFNDWVRLLVDSEKRDKKGIKKILEAYK